MAQYRSIRIGSYGLIRKTHDENRYACSHPSSHPSVFSTWKELQVHTRTAHPPTCPYPGRNGKSFSQQRGLEVHLKIHKRRVIDGCLNVWENTVDNGELEARKRSGREHGRDRICDIEGYTKYFKSVFPLLDSAVAFSRLYVEQKKALTTITSHLHKRDFV